MKADEEIQRTRDGEEFIRDKLQLLLLKPLSQPTNYYHLITDEVTSAFRLAANLHSLLLYAQPS